MGAALAKALVKGPYRLLLFSHNATELEQLKTQIRKETPAADLDCLGCPTDASWEADVIISAVPYSAEKEVAQKIKAVATQKIVVSISNPGGNTFDGLAPASDWSAAEELQTLLPASKVVKAFSSIKAAQFSQPTLSGQPLDVFIAGNDKEAVEEVKGLVRTAGFNPVVAGDLTASRQLEAVPLQ